jgi:hypothetical protein
LLLNQNKNENPTNGTWNLRLHIFLKKKAKRGERRQVEVEPPHFLEKRAKRGERRQVHLPS